MARLEDVKSGLQVNDIIPQQAITIVDVTWHGNVAVEITYKLADGRPGNQLLYRHDEPNLEIVQNLCGWDFSADGDTFRLATQASCINPLYSLFRLPAWLLLILGGANLRIDSNFRPKNRPQSLVSTENPHHSTPENPNAIDSDGCENSMLISSLPALCKKMLINQVMVTDCMCQRLENATNSARKKASKGPKSVTGY